MSPEMLQGEGSGKPSDIWALGVLLYILLTEKKPFNGRTQADVFKKIIAGNFHMPDYLSSQAQDLIRKMLRKSTYRRITAAEILKHPWIT